MPSELQNFYRTAYDRHAIYIRRLVGFPKPWSQEPIFQNSRFCNVFRRIDVTTDWIVQTLDPNDTYLWAMLVVCRFISRIDCLTDIREAGGFYSETPIPDRLKLIRRAMKQRMLDGLPVNTASFITHPPKGAWGPTKADYIYNLIEAMIDNDVGRELEYNGPKSLRHFCEELCEYEGVGSFMAFQYCVDWSYYPQYLMNATDEMTWTAKGPGSVRGLRRLVSGSPEPCGDVDFLEECQSVLYLWSEHVESTMEQRKEEFMDEISKLFPDSWPVGQIEVANKEWGRFCELKMCDVEHWLCEYDKYARGGSLKRRFYGT